MGWAKLQRECSRTKAQKLVLTDIKDAEGHHAADAISRAYGTAADMHHDVAREDDWERVIGETVKTFGRIDVLVNNARVGVGSPPAQPDREEPLRIC